MKLKILLQTAILALLLEAALPASAQILVTFSDLPNQDNLGGSDFVAVPSTYQPLSAAGVTITWGNAIVYGSNTYDGYQDYTQQLNSSAPSVDIGTYNDAGDSGTSVSFTLTFSKPVEVPSLYITNMNGGEDMTVSGYTNPGDATAAASQTVLFTALPFPYHTTGQATDNWFQVTGLSDTPIQELQFTVTNDAGYYLSTIGGFVDNITIDMPSTQTAPEPATWATLFGGLVLLAGFVRRRARA